MYDVKLVNHDGSHFSDIKPKKIKPVATQQEGLSSTLL